MMGFYLATTLKEEWRSGKEVIRRYSGDHAIALDVVEVETWTLILKNPVYMLLSSPQMSSRNSGHFVDDNMIIMDDY